MKRTFKKLLRTGMSLVLVASMMVGMCASAFAKEVPETPKAELNYVSLGDSMNNGYGLPGYDGNNGVFDYGTGSYANKFAEWLVTAGYASSVNHSQLAMSAMRAEDLHWLLELDYTDAEAIALTDGAWDETAWNAKFTTGDYWTYNELCDNYRFANAASAIVNGNPNGKITTGEAAIVAKTYQDAVADADIVSIGMGNGNFGVFAFGRIMEAIGFSGAPEDAMIYNVERAIAECDPEIQASIMALKAELYAAVEQRIGMSIESDPTLAALANTVIYTGLSYVLNYAGSIEAILQLNSDAEIILVALMNTFADETDSDAISIGTMLDAVFTPLNAYIAALPTVMQACGNSVYADATFYYAEAADVECLVEVYETELADSTSVIRSRFVESIVGTSSKPGMVWGLLAPMVPGMVSGAELKFVTLDDVKAYEAMDPVAKAGYAATNADMAISCALYLAFEDAVVSATKSGAAVSLDSILGLGSMDASLFGDVMANFNANIGTAGAAYLDAASTIVAVGSGGTLTPEQVKNLVIGGDDAVLYTACLPVASDMDTSVSEIMAYYIANKADSSNGIVSTINGIMDSLNTAVSSANMICMLLALPETLSAAIQDDDTVSGLMALFGRCVIGNGLGAHPSEGGHNALFEAVRDAYANDYTAKDETIKNATIAAELMAALVAEYYDEAYAAAYKYAEENGYIDATAAAIDALIAELEKINVAAMEMSEAAKAEIEAEIAKAIAALEAAKALLIEDITVLTQETIAALEAALNEGAEAIKNLQNMIKQAAMDAQEEAYAALENAYDTLINVVIPTAKEQLGIAVSEATEWLMEKAQETYDALVEALVEAAEVYGPKAAAALYDYLLNNPEEVIAFFREYGPDAAEFFAENAEVIMEVLDFLVEEFGDDAIAFVMENPVEVLGTMVYLAVEYGDEAWALIVVYAEALGITGEAIENGLADAMEQLSALVKEYGALVAQGAYDYIMEQGYVEALEQAIRDLIAEIESQIDCLENQVCKQIETAIEALEAQIEALEAQIEALKAELENASEELKAEIEAAIEAIEAQIAEIEAAIEAMKAQVEAVQHQIKELYEAALALNDTIEALIEAAKAQTEETIQATIAAIEEAMKAVEDAIDDAKALVEDVVETVENIIDAINSIPEALEQLDEMIAEFVENLGEDIVAELEDMGEQLLADLLAAADALATEGIEALAELVEDLLNDLVDAIEYQLNKAVEAFEKAYLDATTGEYGVGCDSYYVSLGDAAVLSEGTSYADIVAAELEVEYAELADAALTTAGIEGYVAANAEEIAKADLITVSLGTSDISGFVLEQVEAYVNGADTTIDWTALNLDKEIMDVLFGALSETHAFLAEQLTGAEPVDLGFAKVDPVELITLMVDSYLYGTLSFSLNFAPALNAIHAANPEAHVVVVGMANPFEAVVEMMGIEDLDINAVLDAVTSITNLEFLVYTMLTPNTTFVPAPEAESNLNVGAQLGSGFTLVFELAFQTSEAGHAYIAERILNALTVGAEDHVYGEWVSISDTQHQRTCGLCGVAFETEDHDFGEWISAGTNHVRICETCEYVLTGEHADDNDDHECDVCDDKISDCADANSDHKCDICGEAVSEHADANSDHKCDICGEAVSEHADANNDHKCDICGEAVSEHADANNDHKCDICGEAVSEHIDANGDNKCDICDEDLTPEHTHVFSGYKYDEDYHWKECECGHIAEKAAHIFSGRTCTVCAYKEPSSGGSGGSSKPAIDPTPAPVVNPFIDVNTGDYFYNAVLWAVEKGITTGVTETLFAPNDVCTRAQMVTMLWRAMGSPAPKSTTTPFTDISKSAYYYDAVLWGTENGLIKGTSETTFSPEETISRCETVTFLWRSAGAPKATTTCAFTDIDAGAYYYDAVVWAAEEKVTKGTSATTFSPEDPCLRGQILTLMFNHMAE